MRDHIRELDIERALDVRGGVSVDVSDSGTATVVLPRDLLDRLLAGLAPSVSATEHYRSASTAWAA